MFIQPNDTILFQGDSITDSARSGSTDDLGSGYVALIRGMLQVTHPQMNLRVVNRGVNGDRTVELLARWENDCLKIRPNVLSIGIGVNDVWRIREQWKGQTYVPLQDYRNNFCQLLDLAKAIGVRQFILLSPTCIDEEKDPEFAHLLDERTECVKELARKYQAVYIPARETQKQALCKAREVRWTTDGCHPTIAGYALLAAAWMRAVGLYPGKT